MQDPEEEPVREDARAPGEAATAPPANAERQPLPEYWIDAERRAWWISDVIVLVPFGVAVVLGLLLGWFAAWLGVLLAILFVALTIGLVWGTLYWPEIQRRHTFWRLTPRSLELWKGVVWRRHITIPRSRVQHTDVVQGPIQRAFDLATLSVHTAGNQHAKVTFEGLGHDDARAIRDSLTEADEDDVV